MSLLDCQDPELVANVLISHITAAINIIAPMKTVQIRNNYAPYLTEQTKGEMKNRDANKKKAHISGEKKDWDEYKILRNKIKKQQKEEKKQWALDKIKPNLKDSKLLWKTIDDITKRGKQQQITNLNINGKKVESKMEMATGLNNFFVEKVKKNG